MSNHGVKWNETERTLAELHNLTHETREQRDAKTILRFLKYKEVDGLVHRSAFIKNTQRRTADFARLDCDDFRFPWEPRTPGFTKEPEPEKPPWLQRELNPPWWLRFARRFKRNVTIAESFGDEWHRGEYQCPKCGHYQAKWHLPRCEVCDEWFNKHYLTR